MLRAISCIFVEGQRLRRNESLKVFRMCAHSSVKSDPTVLSQDRVQNSSGEHSPTSPTPTSSTPPPPPPPRSRRAFTIVTALTFTASLGGVYLYRKITQEKDVNPEHNQQNKESGSGVVPPEEQSIPARAEDLPSRVQYLLVGGGTASFAAMRAIRSARPDAHVLLVSRELALPYMRPPLSKELWREPELAALAARPDALSFRQWNGRRRSVLYEPSAFYTPPDRLREGGPGAGVARGWRVTAVDPDAHTAQLESASGERAVVTYEKCLIASGVRPRRLAALREAAAAGRSFAVRELRDVAELARRLDEPGARTVAVVGGGLLAAELSAALAERLGRDGRVLQLYRERAPLAGLLPPYLAAHAARTLAALGVTLVPQCEVVGGAVAGGRVRLALAEGAPLEADVVVECVGSEPDAELARRSRLETHGALGGLLVNGELQSRTDVWAAGDVACFYDEALGRRRVEHHDHAVVSGRLAGENMAAVRAPRPYTHQSMFWSDLGQHLGYEAIGIIDSNLQTVGVFCDDAVQDASTAALAVSAAGRGEVEARGAGEVEARGAGEVEARGEGEAVGAVALPETRALLAASAAAAASAPGDVASTKRYERGVVFYLRDQRVVGVLLWNLFNRMHVARQVLARGEFEDLFEVAKLFSLHEED